MARITQVVARRLQGGFWELVEPLEYHVGAEDSEEVITVPIGTRTDFASVPFGFRNLFPKDGDYTPAAIVHDWLYQTVGLKGRFTRKRCDEIFLEAMGVVGVGWIARHTMYRAVRMFGWAPWNGHKKRKQSFR